MLPLAKAVKCALSASILRNRKKPRKHSKNFAVELAAVCLLGLSVDGQHVPPHITRAIERVGWLLVEVGQVRRTSNRHDLLEKWNKRAKCTKTNSHRNLGMDQGIHKVGATVADEIPKTLIELSISKVGK